MKPVEQKVHTEHVTLSTPRTVHVKTASPSFKLNRKISRDDQKTHVVYRGMGDEEYTYPEAFRPSVSYSKRKMSDMSIVVDPQRLMIKNNGKAYGDTIKFYPPLSQVSGVVKRFRVLSDKFGSIDFNDIDPASVGVTGIAIRKGEIDVDTPIRVPATITFKEIDSDENTIRNKCIAEGLEFVHYSKDVKMLRVRVSEIKKIKV